MDYAQPPLFPLPAPETAPETAPLDAAITAELDAAGLAKHHTQQVIAHIAGYCAAAGKYLSRITKMYSKTRRELFNRLPLLRRLKRERRLSRLKLAILQESISLGVVSFQRRVSLAARLMSPRQSVDRAVNQMLADGLLVQVDYQYGRRGRQQPFQFLAIAPELLLAMAEELAGKELNPNPGIPPQPPAFNQNVALAKQHFDALPSIDHKHIHPDDEKGGIEKRGWGDRGDRGYGGDAPPVAAAPPPRRAEAENLLANSQIPDRLVGMLADEYLDGVSDALEYGASPEQVKKGWLQMHQYQEKHENEYPIGSPRHYFAACVRRVVDRAREAVAKPPRNAKPPAPAPETAHKPHKTCDPRFDLAYWCAECKASGKNPQGLKPRWDRQSAGGVV